MQNIKRKAIIGAIGMAIVTGVLQMLMTAMAILQTSFCELHGYTPTQFSVVLSVFSGAGIIAGMLLGKLVSTFGIKKLAVLSAFGPLICMVGLRYASSIFLACAVSLVGGILVGLATSAVMGMYIGSWFNKGKGTMMSIAQTLCSVCAIVLVPVVTKTMVELGAKNAPIVVGIILSALTMIGAIMVKGMPSVYGAQPVDLAEKEKKSGRTPIVATEIYNVQMPATKMVTKLPVLAALLMTFLAVLALAMFGTYAVYIYDSFIGNMVTASLYVSIASAIAVGFSMLFGVLCDRIGVIKSIIIYGLLTGVSKVIGPFIGGNTGAILIMILNGAQVFATMYIGVGFPLILGYKSLATVAGWAGSLMSAGGMLAPVFAMFLVSVSGSYDLVVIVTGVLMLVCMLIGAFCVSEKSRESMKAADKKWLAQNAQEQSK